VYLPAGCLWYDFWTHESYSGGQEITAPAPLDIMPIYVKAGSIIPMTEVAQHAAASTNREITLRIYPGADGRFTLYQDEQDNYHYEHGAYSTIELSWDNDQGILSLGERQGQFAWMEETIDFTIDVIGKNAKQTVYQGKQVSVLC
jgi:alpha-D-xyloside xylohydrolase